ncbi:MAG: hypothetical protein U1F23_06615 [Lysobacterales bacterium]
MPNPIILNPVVTPLTSTAVRMISYRHENHSWQSSDRAVHILINQGNQPGNDALRLFSTVDRGVSWLSGPSFSDSGETSTQDGFLAGNLLDVVYSTSANDIKFASLRWNPASSVWTSVGSSTVFASSTSFAVNPGIAADAAGNLWVPFVVGDLTTFDNSIRMIVQAAGSGTWTDTGLVFGTVDNASIERSARPVRIPGGMGMVFTVHDDFYWATRPDSAGLDDSWSVQPLYTRTGEGTDPYASHFSLVADAAGNVHLATVDGGQLIYLRYDAASGTWAPPRQLTNQITGAYPQVSIMPGVLVVALDIGTNAGVYVSRDSGTTFSYIYKLVHGMEGGGNDFTYPRLETPTYAASPLLLFQQFSNGATEKLMQYTIPVRVTSSAVPVQ